MKCFTVFISLFIAITGFSQDSIPGFKHAGNGKPPVSKDTLQFYERVAVQDMGRYINQSVYIERINRWIRLLGVDKTKNVLLVQSDYNGGMAVALDKTAGRVFLKIELNEEGYISCPTIETRAKYKYVKEEILWKDSKGRVILTHKDRSGYAKSTSFGTREKKIHDGYETIPCRRCNGTGKVAGNKKIIRYRKVDFSVKTAFEKTLAAIQQLSIYKDKTVPKPGFGSKEFITEEANNYLVFYYKNKEDKTGVAISKYLRDLQYRWINLGQYEDFFYDHYARLIDEIFHKDKQAATTFLHRMNTTAFRKTFEIIGQKDISQRAYYNVEFEKIRNKK